MTSKQTTKKAGKPVLSRRSWLAGGVVATMTAMLMAVGVAATAHSAQAAENAANETVQAHVVVADVAGQARADDDAVKDDDDNVDNQGCHCKPGPPGPPGIPGSGYGGISTVILGITPTGGTLTPVKVIGLVEPNGSARVYSALLGSVDTGNWFNITSLTGFATVAGVSLAVDVLDQTLVHVTAVSDIGLVSEGICAVSIPATPLGAQPVVGCSAFTPLPSAK